RLERGKGCKALPIATPLSCDRGPPVHSVRPAPAAVAETGYGDRPHCHRSPSPAVPWHPTGRAPPDTGPVACDTTHPQAHGTLDACACPAPRPRGETTGKRARHDRGETHTP